MERELREDSGERRNRYARRVALGLFRNAAQIAFEIAQGDHIWGGPRAGGLYGTCIARDDGVI